MLCRVLKIDSENGYLPPGVHRMGLAEFVRLFVWNSRRRFLFAGFARAIAALRAAGCRAVVVDGSFVTAEEHPGDWDAAFDPVGVDKGALDPILIKHDDGRKAMNAKYLGDLFPWTARASNPSGPLYRQFFQKDRDGVPKGVVEIELLVLQ